MASEPSFGPLDDHVVGALDGRCISCAVLSPCTASRGTADAGPVRAAASAPARSLPPQRLGRRLDLRQPSEYLLVVPLR